LKSILSALLWIGPAEIRVRAARLLGVKATTLNAKVKRYKISFMGREAKVEQDVRSHEMAA